MPKPTTPKLARALTALTLLIVLFAMPLTAAQARSKHKPRPWRPVSAEILMDARTGKVLRARNADVVTYPASLTKMMTLMLTFEALDHGRLRLGQPLKVSRHAASMAPSRLGVAPGATITAEEAILALVTKSANDVAVVLAEAVGGSETAFAASMTQRARALGMRHTVFRNASGLPHRGQRTTARDMAILSRALISHHRKYYGYFNRRSFDWQGDTVYGHNRLMARYDGMDGIKTGFIAASGFNLAASAARQGHRLIAVVLGGETAAKRDARVAELLDQGFRAHTRLRPAEAVAETHDEPTAQGDAPLNGPPTATADKPAADWSIQVGAFKNRRAARRGADAAAKALGRLVDDGEPRVVHDGGFYKARVAGLDAGTAAAACKALAAQRQDCLALHTR